MRLLIEIDYDNLKSGLSCQDCLVFIWVISFLLSDQYGESFHLRYIPSHSFDLLRKQLRRQLVGYTPLPSILRAVPGGKPISPVTCSSGRPIIHSQIRT